MKHNKETNNLRNIMKAFNKIEKETLLAQRRGILREQAFINKNTGEISFAGKDLVLNPDMRRYDLGACPECIMTADASAPGSDRRTYYLRDHYIVARMNFSISIYCEGDRIKEVWLRNARMDFQDYGWHWSEKKQYERIRVHEKWMERVFGNKRTNDFPWGRIVSCYNPVMGVSYIALVYCLDV